MVEPSIDLRGEDDRSPAVFIAMALVAAPLLRPHGPGHVTPADVFVGAAILAVIVWAGTYRVPLHLPYLVPMAILVTVGLLAAMFSVDTDSGVLAIAQDVFLFAWAAAIANAIRSPRTLSIILAAWTWGAIAWASVLILAVITHLSWLSGGQVAEGARAQLWFDNPNMAGNYFLLSLVVLLLGRHPQKRVVRVCGFFLLVTAIAFTGSNAALLSLVLGGLTAGFFALWRRTDLVIAVAAGAMVAALLIGLAYLEIERGLLPSIEDGSNSFVERSIARSPRSAAGRANLFAEEFELYRTGSFLGLGPASTKANLERSFGQIVKEAHDDYLATLVERGPIGFVGLVILMAGIGVRAYSDVMRPLSPAFARLLKNPSAIIAGVMALAVFAMTHEILHYRHVWAFLGIVAGLYLFGRRVPSRSVFVGSPSSLVGSSSPVGAH